jgi:hypothetical protein
LAGRLVSGRGRRAVKRASHEPPPAAANPPSTMAGRWVSGTAGKDKERLVSRVWWVHRGGRDRCGGRVEPGLDGRRWARGSWQVAGQLPPPSREEESRTRHERGGYLRPNGVRPFPCLGSPERRLGYKVEIHISGHLFAPIQCTGTCTNYVIAPGKESIPHPTLNVYLYVTFRNIYRHPSLRMCVVKTVFLVNPRQRPALAGL